jgi:hypothetical protein
MKIAIVLTILSSMAFAQDEKSQNLDQLKKMIAGNIDQHITMLQSFKSCVQSASGKEQLQDCRKTNKEAMEKFKQENKSERESFREKIKSSREEKREKRNKKED